MYIFLYVRFMMHVFVYVCMHVCKHLCTVMFRIPPNLESPSPKDFSMPALLELRVLWAVEESRALGLQAN